jgi:hypothetical protein
MASHMAARFRVSLMAAAIRSNEVTLADVLTQELVEACAAGVRFARWARRRMSPHAETSPRTM